MVSWLAQLRRRGTLTVSDIDSLEAFQAATIGGQHGTLVTIRRVSGRIHLIVTLRLRVRLKGLIR